MVRQWPPILNIYKVHYWVFGLENKLLNRSTKDTGRLFSCLSWDSYIYFMQMSPELALRSPSFIMPLNKEREREALQLPPPPPSHLLPANKLVIFLLLLSALRKICNSEGKWAPGVNLTWRVMIYEWGWVPVGPEPWATGKSVWLDTGKAEGDTAQSPGSTSPAGRARRLKLMAAM